MRREEVGRDDRGRRDGVVVGLVIVLAPVLVTFATCGELFGWKMTLCTESIGRTQKPTPPNIPHAGRGLAFALNQHSPCRLRCGMRIVTSGRKPIRAARAGRLPLC